MVGREAGRGDQRQDVPSLRGAPEGRAVIEAGTGVPECGGKVLEQRAWASESCPGCRAAGEALTADKFYDAIGGGPLPVGCSPDEASCEIFRYRMVHGIETRCDSEPEMVDGQS